MGHLFVEDGTSDLALDISTGEEPLQFAGLGVPVDDHDTPVLLQANGDEIAGFVEREMPRAYAPCGEGLDQAQSPSAMIQGEIQEGIGRDLRRVLGVKAWDLQSSVISGCHNQELGVGLSIMVSLAGSRAWRWGS